MMTIFTLKRFWTSIAMVLAVAFSMNMNAQTDFPWHVVVSDNGKEVASHSVEIITDLQVTSQDVTFVLDDGKTFPYPTATSTFAFEQRAGNGTAIGVVTAPQWNVYYNENSLHFTESVNSVAVYTVSGILIAKVSGNYTDVPVNLAKGIYIVQAGGKTVKLLVSNNGSGAVYAQPAVVESAPHTSYALNTSSSVTLRTTNAAVFKEYWNVYYANTVIPIKIAQVSSFYFVNDAVVFTMVDGNTIKLNNYQSTAYSAQPAQSTSNWDMNLSQKIAGATYGFDYSLGSKAEFISVATPTDIIIFNVATGTESRCSRANISSVLLNIDGSRISFFNGGGDAIFPAISFFYIEYGMEEIYFRSLLDVDRAGRSPISNYSFNGGTNQIPTIFETGKDGNLVTTYTNADGVVRQHTFTK